MADINTSDFWVSLLKKIVKIIAKNMGLSTRAPTHNQHVVPHPDGWAVRGEGNEKYTAVYDLQSEAIERAKDIAHNYRSSVIIHGKNGKIRDRISYD